jgi:hypothetical protein
MSDTHPGNYKIEPEYLGPLGDRPIAATGVPGGAEALFPGASAFLSARQQRRRGEQWATVLPLAKRLLRPDEHVLYVAHGMQMPPVLHMMALGHMALAYHQVVVVLTDSRLIEIMLDVRGRRAGTRVRSFPWSGVRGLKVGFGKLTLEPSSGRKQAWKLPLRGDRRMLEPLVARLRPRLMQEGAGHAVTVPLWHCPRCAHDLPANPAACEHCRTTFRTTRLAALLSLAFPGAGLFYAGHPFLAVMDCLGEMVLYGLFLMLAVEAQPGAAGIAIGVGVLFFVLTKLQSVHLSSILVSRTKPEAESTRAGYRKLALVGGLASFILIGGAFPLIGAARPVVDRDLAPAGADNLWQVSRDRSEWESFADDPTARSRWSHPSGLHVTVFAYPQGLMSDLGEFRADYERQMAAAGAACMPKDDVPSPFEGFSCISHRKDGEGRDIALVHYIVLDREHHDVHQLASTVLDEDAPTADGLMRDLLQHAQWVEAAPPVGAANAAGTAGAPSRGSAR